jgi:hypothetical protein
MKNFMLIIGILAIIGVAGSSDYTEEVIYNMPRATYKAMQAEGMTDSTIAEEYQKNKSHWNNIGKEYEVRHAGED